MCYFLNNVSGTLVGGYLVRSLLFLVLTATCLTVCKASMSAVLSSECSGDIPHQTASYIDDSLKILVSELPADEFGECVLGTHGEMKPDGISLRVKLVCEGEETLEETRIVTSASAAAQARTMTRNLLKKRADSSMIETPTVETDILEPVEEEKNHKTSARAGMVIGAALEFTGFFATGAAYVVGVTSENDNFVAGVLVASGFFVLGNLISTAAHTRRFSAYLDAGLSPRPNLLLISWLLTATTVGLYIGAIIENATFDEDDSDCSDISTASLGLILLSLIPEVLDLSLARTFLRREFRRTDARAKPSVSVAPIFFKSRVGYTRSVSPGLGVMGTF